MALFHPASAAAREYVPVMMAARVLLLSVCVVTVRSVRMASGPAARWRVESVRNRTIPGSWSACVFVRGDVAGVDTEWVSALKRRQGVAAAEFLRVDTLRASRYSCSSVIQPENTGAPSQMLGSAFGSWLAIATTA